MEASRAGRFDEVTSMATKRSGAGGKKKPARAMAKPKAPRKRAATPAKAKAKASPTQRASVLAARMPLVHYPARDKMARWSRWPALLSPAACGKLIGPDDFEQLRGTHVF